MGRFNQEATREDAHGSFAYEEVLPYQSAVLSDRIMGAKVVPVLVFMDK
jgi:hypothetical protein